MDQADLYDQFGNYMGPELESDEEDDDEQQNGYRQELGNVDQTSDMVCRWKDKIFFFLLILIISRKMMVMKLEVKMKQLMSRIYQQLLFCMKIKNIIQVL